MLPNDIDINLHMNNGRYQTICDLTRVDVFIRTGLACTILREKWMLLIAEHTMTYKKPLKILHKYEVKMEITGWDEGAFNILHTFLVNNRVVAEDTSRGVIVGRSGVMAPEDVMDCVNRHRTG